MADGFEVDLDGLREARDGVSRTMQDMESCEVRAICGEQTQYGHAGIHEAFGLFCQRWQYGVEVLIEDGEDITEALGAAVETYAGVEEAVTQSFTQGDTGGAG